MHSLHRAKPIFRYLGANFRFLVRYFRFLHGEMTFCTVKRYFAPCNAPMHLFRHPQAQRTANGRRVHLGLFGWSLPPPLHLGLFGWSLPPSSCTSIPMHRAASPDCSGGHCPLRSTSDCSGGRCPLIHDAQAAPRIAPDRHRGTRTPGGTQARPGGTQARPRCTERHREIVRAVAAPERHREIVRAVAAPCRSSWRTDWRGRPAHREIVRAVAAPARLFGRSLPLGLDG